MKVLDPQSALLTNAEVYQFLQAKGQRNSDLPQGAYVITNLTGHKAVLKDFETYTQETTAHVTSTPPVDKWINILVQRLKPYELTKTEVMNLINIGLGIRKPVAPQEAEGTEQVNGEVKLENREEEKENDEEGEAALLRDIQFFRVVVEESDERFEGEDGEERIKEVIQIMKVVVLSPSDELAD